MAKPRSGWLPKDLRERKRLDEPALLAVIARALDKFTGYSSEERVRVVTAALLSRGYYRSARALSDVLATRKDGM